MADDTAPPRIENHQTRPPGVLPLRVKHYAIAGFLGLLVLGSILSRCAARPVVQDRTVGLPDKPPVTRPRQPIRIEDVGAPPPLAVQPKEREGARATTSTPQVDPIEADRKKRAYESLYSSNIVVSRRLGAALPMGTSDRGSRFGGATKPPSSDRQPSLQETARAVIDATREAGLAAGPMPPAAQPVTPPVPPQPQQRGRKEGPERTPPLDDRGAMHTLLEGTIVDAVLQNRLDGSTASPVSIMVTNPVYSHDRQHVLIPAGAELVGESKPVQSFGESRLAVTFHRLKMPDGSTVSLEQFKGLDQAGATGLKDKVNRHYLSTFLTAAGIGLITGAAQAVGTRGYGSGDGNNRNVIVTGDVANTTSQAMSQTLQRELNRLPTITIREGLRLRVWLAEDLSLPAYVEKER